MEKLCGLCGQAEIAQSERAGDFARLDLKILVPTLSLFKCVSRNTSPCTDHCISSFERDHSAHKDHELTICWSTFSSHQTRLTRPFHSHIYSTRRDQSTHGNRTIAATLI